MRILFCCQFYAPSVGGVQEVMRQLAERLVARGHQVTVATTALVSRNFTDLNGVKICEFDVSGNLVSGMTGEVDLYRNFILQNNYDVIMIKAAQQWTFDAIWPLLDEIKPAKVFIPCGFSGMYEPGYTEYFLNMPAILRKFDHLIFYATQYRDIDFAREHKIDHFSIIPNGASEIEFNVSADHTFKSRHEIAPNSFVFMTVGSFTGLKGHLELVNSFALMEFPDGMHATLILNGNDSSSSLLVGAGIVTRLLGAVKIYGWQYALKSAAKRVLFKAGFNVGKAVAPQSIALQINQRFKDRRVIVSNFNRDELVQAYMATDLFVFASNIEYSPLVLFESTAAGTPFLTVAVGNSEEIAAWTGAGLICSSYKDKKGYTRVHQADLAREMERTMLDKNRLIEMGATGRRNWKEKFTWEKISHEYEQVFVSLMRNISAK